MTNPRGQLTVAILEHRFTKEFSSLLERFGVAVYACPLLEEKPVENREELEHFVRQLSAGNLDTMIFLTGVGARFLVSAADSISLKDQFLHALGKMTIVVRGPKPVSALRQFGVRVDIVPDNPTTEGIIEALRSKDLQGSVVGVQLYGTPNPQLVSSLESRGAKVFAVQVYAYGAASDTASVNALINKILNDEIQVIAFTSGPQVRMLFDFARQFGSSDAVTAKLKNSVVIASVGDVTSRALEEHGLIPGIVPKQPKMGALAQAVADHFEKAKP
jgi:uroporphyrinogen-III synthase